ncbi:MAG: cold shock domain-containing protein [Chloroflexota bacterium]
MLSTNKGLIKWYDKESQSGVILANDKNIGNVLIEKGVVPSGVNLDMNDPVYFDYSQNSKGVWATAVEISSKSKGKVKWFDHKKKFGYITPNQSGKKDVLVTYQVIQSDWEEFNWEDIVLYDFVDTPKGPRASWVDSFGQP